MASGIMALACLGDAVLYPVLPVYAAEWGISMAWVGVLLSINRLVRVFSNTWVANVVRLLGPKNVLLLASGLAVLSTAVYGLSWGLASLLMARVVWGINYSGLKISTFSYAARLGSGSGLAFGIAQSTKSLGVVLALWLGPMLIDRVGITTGFLIIAFVSAWAIPSAMQMAETGVKYKSVGFRKTFTPTPMNLLVFVFAMAIEGIIVVVLAELLRSRTVDDAHLLSMVAFYLLLGRLFMTGNSFISGVISLKVSPSILFAIAVTSCLIGMLLIALNWVETGIIITFFFNAVLVSFSPLMAISMYGDNYLQSISGISTWWDLGAGLGVFSGFFLFETLGQRTLFLAVTTLCAFFFIHFVICYAKSGK